MGTFKALIKHSHLKQNYASFALDVEGYDKFDSIQLFREGRKESVNQFIPLKKLEGVYFRYNKVSSSRSVSDQFIP